MILLLPASYQSWPNKSVQATAAAPGVFMPSGFSVVMVSFLSRGPASVPDLWRWPWKLEGPIGFVKENGTWKIVEF